MSNRLPADELFDVRQEIKRLQEREKELKKVFIDDRESRVGDDKIVVVYDQSRSTVDWKKLAKDLKIPDSKIELYTRTNVSEVVKIEDRPSISAMRDVILDGVFYVVDCETTGLSPAKGDRMVTLNITKCAMEYENGQYAAHILASYDYLLNPGRESAPSAEKVHGHTREMTLTYPPFSTVAEDVYEKLNGEVIVGQNIPFDMDFINTQLVESGLKELRPKGLIDTKVFSRILWPDQSSSMSEVVKRLGIGEQKDTHTAREDSELTAKLLAYQLTEAEMRG